MLRLSRWLRREWLSLILAALAIAMALNCIYAPRGLGDLLFLRRHRARMEATRERLRAADVSLRTSIQKLRSDDRYLQSLIRRELGFARPGEIIYKFAADNPAPAP